MARSFVTASSQYFANASAAPVAAAPLSISAWYLPTVTANDKAIVCLYNTAADRLLLYQNQAVVGLFSSNAATSGQASSAAATVAAGTLVHVGGSSSGSSNRQAYVNGVASGSANTTTVTYSGALNRTYVGAYNNGAGPVAGFYANGVIAEVGIWDVVLTAEEWAALGAGCSPLMIRPQSLTAYWPLLGRATDEEDWVGSIPLTNTNSATVADQPRIIYPARQGVILLPTAAGGSTYNDSVAETASATDAPATALVAGAAVAEAATATDAPATALIAAAAASEAASATDAASTALLAAAALAEPAAAADAPAATQIIAAGLAESASAADAVSSGPATYSVDIAEAASAADACLTAMVAGATLTETSPAIDAATGQLVGAVALTAAGAAADSYAATGGSAVRRTSVFLDLRNAVYDLLNANPALADGFILKGRAIPLPPEKDQGIFVRLGRATGQAPFMSSTKVDWDADVVVTLAARAAAGSDGETAVDELLMDVYARLATAPSPPYTDGWVIQPSLVWDCDEADRTLGAAELRLRVRPRSAEGSLAAES